MFAKFMTAAVLAATAIGGIAATPAEARRHYRDGYYGNGYYDRGYDRRWGGRDRYYRGGGYRGGRCYDKGNGGLAIGAVAGGLLGNTIAGRGDRTLGTVIGAAGGGLLGRSIDRSDGRRC